MVVLKFIFKSNLITLLSRFAFIPKTGIGLPKPGNIFYLLCVQVLRKVIAWGRWIIKIATWKFKALACRLNLHIWTTLISGPYPFDWKIVAHFVSCRRDKWRVITRTFHFGCDVLCNWAVLVRDPQLKRSVCHVGGSPPPPGVRNAHRRSAAACVGSTKLEHFHRSPPRRKDSLKAFFHVCTIFQAA